MSCLLRLWLLVHVCNTTVMKYVHRKTFFSTKQIVYLKWTLGICITFQFTLLQGNINFQFVPFLEYCYKIFGAQYFLRALQVKMAFLLDDRNVHKYVSVLNFTIICIKFFSCNNTIFSVSFLNEILFLHVFLNTTITDLHLKFDRTLTDWLCKHLWVIFLPKCIHLL